jgi:hypothetical protein
MLATIPIATTQTGTRIAIMRKGFAGAGTEEMGV